jgi:hypothetical protein
MRMSYEDAQRARDNQGPEDYEYHPVTREQRQQEAEDEAARRSEE